MSHTIEAALERGELTEEEAFFILRFAGQLGYKQAIARLHPGNAFQRFCHHARQWFIWFGGWERTELTQWDRGAKPWEFFTNYDGQRKLAEPFPLSLFGHRITFHGTWFNFKVKRGVWVTVNHNFKCGQFYAYWSDNGTPPDGRTATKGRYFFNRRWKIKELASEA